MDRHTKPCLCPNPRPLYFGLKSINCLRRDSFDCKSIPSCNCPGEKGNFQSVRVCIQTVIPKGVRSVLLFPLLASDRYILINPAFLLLLLLLLLLLSIPAFIQPRLKIGSSSACCQSYAVEFLCLSLLLILWDGVVVLQVWFLASCDRIVRWLSIQFDHQHGCTFISNYID